MSRSPIFYVLVGVGGVWLYHHFIMPVIGLGVTYVGYSLLYYGLTQVQGGNWGLLDLMLPSRWTPEKATTARDGVGG